MRSGSNTQPISNHPDHEHFRVSLPGIHSEGLLYCYRICQLEADKGIRATVLSSATKLSHSSEHANHDRMGETTTEPRNTDEHTHITITKPSPDIVRPRPTTPY